MPWVVQFHDEFAAEVESLAAPVKEELLAQAGLLESEGPTLGRPTVDTLKGSSFTNMKELRFNVDGGVWRVAFAFDPRRDAILLVAGNKSGLRNGGEKRFYKQLIADADQRFSAHLRTLKKRS